MIDLRTSYDALMRIRFQVTGKRPWTRGYVPYRDRFISTVLRSGTFDPRALPQGYGVGLDERAIEYPWLFARLPRGAGRLLDAGSVLNYDFLLTRNDMKAKKVFISTLAPESRAFWKYGISYVFEDLRETCFRDGFFDWVVSLSTIEHIGLDNTLIYTKDGSKRENIPDAYLTAVKEYGRILKKGGLLYLSFPFGAYKNHGWFQVFDDPMIDRVIDVFSPSSVAELIFRYEPGGWKISNREESGRAVCFDATARKNYKKGYPSFSEAIACLELKK
jgi:SAM-dependent methyltransferase